MESFDLEIKQLNYQGQVLPVLIIPMSYHSLRKH